MSRPALAALRGMQILEFLATVPERRFSLTEIALATRVNRASCLAILAELAQRGFLCRHVSRKTYWLGPALIAAGTTAEVANPILRRARGAAERLRGELGLPVLLSTRVRDEIVCVYSLPDAGRTAGLRAGERVPLVPPIGASFVAWSTPDAAEAWVMRRVDAGEERTAARLRKTLTVTRAQGFHVTLRRPEADDIASSLARAASGDRTPDFHRHAADTTETPDEPDMLDDSVLYDILLIAAPVIDPETSAIYNLCIGGFCEPLTGTAIATLGRRLTAACVGIMNTTGG